MFSRAVASAAMLSLLLAPPAVAADLDWQIVSGMSTDYLQRQVQRIFSAHYEGESAGV